jgi:hypothetical protein
MIIKESYVFDFHESVHRDTIMKITNKMHYINKFIIPIFMFVPCISNNKIPLLKIQLMHLLCQLDKTKLKIKSH